MKTHLTKAENIPGNERAAALRERQITRLDTLKSQGIEEDDENMEFIPDGMHNKLKIGPKRSTLTKGDQLEIRKKLARDRFN